MNTNEDSVNGKDVRSELEKFLHHSQWYLNQTQIIKEELNDINRQDHADVYIRTLNEFDKNIQTLMQDRQHIEQLGLQLNENERLTMESQVQSLRDQIDHQISELHRLREETVDDENNLPIDPSTTDPNNIEENTSPNVLRQRHASRNPLDATYDMLERDLIYLRQTVDDIDKLVTEQGQKLSRIELYRTIVHNRLNSASSLLSNIFHNRFVTTAAGAAVGAGIGGPVGLTMGAKIGALVALSGSALGALSMNIMRQRVAETDQVENNDVTPYSQAML